jgi:tetratricopeptide (TPR) repeat protein
MKRSERHHLKENPVAQLVWDLREATIGHTREAAYGVIAVVVLAAAVGVYFYWQGRKTGSAEVMLAAAVVVAETPVVPPAPGATPATPASRAQTFPSERARHEAALPKYLAVIEAYPATTAATIARYEAANILTALGRAAEAEPHYQEVIARDGTGIYAQMARLGLAAARGAAGQFDQAIEIYQQLSTAQDTRLPVDGILMQLGRTYVKAGKTGDAVRVYTRIVEEFPQSLYVADARAALETLKKS